MDFRTYQRVLHSLSEHTEEATAMFEPWQFVMIGLQGSQNYGLEVENSDVDTKFIVTPTFKEIAMNEKPVSTTHVRANEEHIDLKDIRLMLQTFKKQNMNFVELLFTQFYLTNPLYSEQWGRLVREREAIAHYSPYAAVKTMKGIALEKYHAMEHEYPSKIEILKQYGYDPKQLHHLLRVEEYLHRYIKGESYEECLRPRDPEYLRSVKLGKYNLDEARTLAAAAVQDVIDTTEEYMTTHEATCNPVIGDLIDDVQYQIMEISVRKELN